MKCLSIRSNSSVISRISPYGESRCLRSVLHLCLEPSFGKDFLFFVLRIVPNRGARCATFVEHRRISGAEPWWLRRITPRAAIFASPIRSLASGPLDLVFVPGFISNLDHYWDEPTVAHFLNRLGSFSRLILFDKRGTGLSDRLGNLPTLEERMDDVRAVMDAVESERAALFGISEGGAMSVLFAATYPERTQALILYGTYAHFHTWVLPPDRFEPFLEKIEQSWGTGASLSAFAPTKVTDERFKQWWARFERLECQSHSRHHADADEQPDRRSPYPSSHSCSNPRSCIAQGIRGSMSRAGAILPPTYREQNTSSFRDRSLPVGR